MYSCFRVPSFQENKKNFHWIGSGQSKSVLPFGRASIASGYTPATVPGGSPGPLLRPEGQRAERRNARLLHAGITMPLTKRTAVSQKGVENPPVWPCEPLCGANGAGAASICPPEQVFSSWRHRVTEGSDDCWNTLPPESRVNLPSVKNIVGEKEPALLLRGSLLKLPAVRAVAGILKGAVL